MTALLLAFMLIVPIAFAQSTSKAEAFDDDEWPSGWLNKKYWDYWDDLDQWLYDGNNRWGWE